MPTFHPIMDGAIKTDGTKAIYILITSRLQRAKVSTGMSVPERHWNAKKREVRVGHRQYEALNRAIGNVANALQAIYANARANGMELSAQEIKAAYLTPANVEGKIQFFAFCYEYFDRLDAAGKFNTVRARRSIIHKFHAWLNVPDIDFEVITPILIEKYIAYLRGINGPSTVHVNIKRIKEQFLRANRLGIFSGNPFINIRVATSKPKRDKLNIAEVKAIESLPATLARDLWLFSFYCAGIRFGDMCTLRPSDVRGGVLKYSMSKTGHVREIKMHERAIEIMNRYSGGKWMFPVLDERLFGLKPTPENITEIKRAISSKNVTINKGLKLIAQLAGIDKRLTFHVSRHTFADIARKKKLPVQVTSELLGHTSIAITQQYFGTGFDDDTLDAAIRSVIE
jgi:integrase